MTEEQEIARRAGEELAAGRHWRAKEILRGAMPRPYSPFLAEELGKVLLAMHDAPEAGRYLFLSGARHPDYEESIALWLKRAGKRDPHLLYQNFFKQAKLGKLDAYPERVRQDLLELGVDEEEFGDGNRLPSIRGWIWGLFGLLVALAMIACFATGVGVLVKELRRWLEGV